MSHSTIRINSPAVVGEVLDDEAVIIHLGTGAYYSLNNSGSLLWTDIEQGTTRSNLVGKLLDRYEVSEPLATRHIEHFLAVLQDEALIVNLDNDTSNLPISLPVGAEKLSYEPPQLMKYTDMQELILLDPIHDVDEKGWPHIKQI
jgi:Coenzyme PQQ synthesis protein D (PqqD)